MFFALCILLIGCDRVTKEVAKARIGDGTIHSYLHDVLRLEYTENTGAAMGLGERLSPGASLWILSIIPLVVMACLSVYVIRKSGDMNSSRFLAFALIIAGGLGNIVDRLMFHRHVTDFLNLGIGDLRTAIFNFADFYIMVGIGLLIFTRTRTPQTV
jgi:signal peptidase II